MRALPQPLINRAVIWRAKGDFERAIADTTEAIRLAKAKAPVNIMTPPGSVQISAYSKRGLAHNHVGSLRAPDAEMALRNARDVYTRRQEGVSIWVVPAASIMASGPQHGASTATLVSQLPTSRRWAWMPSTRSM